MKTKITLLIALLATLGFGQASLSSTTLGAAVTATTQTNITLASTSTMLAPGPNGQINTVIYVDREFMWVQSVVDSTHVTVTRAKGIGASAYPQLHANGAKVYFANTTTYSTVAGIAVPAARFFRNEQPNTESNGACTSTNELVLPKIYLFSGDIMNCLSSGQWILVGNGTMGHSGEQINAFCSGTVGSAATDYLVGAACSTSTASTIRYTIATAGTLANLRAFSSAAFVGTGSSTFTVLKNGTATAIVCAPVAAATTCADTTHSVAVVPGDTLSISFLSSTSDTAANLSAVIGLF